MDDRHDKQNASAGAEARTGAPDLILQAVVPPTDAPAEIRAAVAELLAGRDPAEGPAPSWEDVSFAASALAFIQGTNQRAVPDTEWVFALRAESPRPGEQIHSCGAWSNAIHSSARSSGADSRLLWRVSVYDALTTAPRGVTAG